jgi:hypothetical protein
MKPVSPDIRQPARNANVRKVPDCTNDSASPPPSTNGLLIAVDVMNTITASGIRMTPMVLN